MALGCFTAQAAVVNFDLSASYNYDAYVTGEEIANNINVDGTLGDHTLLKSVSGWAHLVDPGGTYIGITNTTINGGEFELAAGLTGDKFGTATGTTKVNNTVADLSTDGSLATVRTKTVMLEAAQQGKYSDFNVLVTANRYGVRTVTMTALIEVKYVGDANWYTAWTESQIPTAGEPGGCFGGGFNSPTGTDSHQSAAWTEVLVNGDIANGYYKNTSSASGTDYMYKLAVAPSLNPAKTLEGFKFTASTTDASRYNDFILYAISATLLPGGGNGPTDLVFDNATPEQFVQQPGIATNLSFIVKNNGSDATNVTVSLTGNQSWLTADSTIHSIPLIGSGGSATNVFNVTIDQTAPVGVSSNAFTLTMNGTGKDNTNRTFSAQVGLEILNTVFPSINKTAFAAPVGGSDTATLTIANTASWALSYSLSSVDSWLEFPTGTLGLPAGGSTNITVTANATGIPTQGRYTDTLTVTYFNNTSLPNPKTFPVVFDVGSKIEPLLASAVITETGEVNLLPGQYEPGEILNIAVTSTNNGAITVTNIAHVLSADPAYFTISAISNPSNYASMVVGASATTTYQVTIASGTPMGVYTFAATNSADGISWGNTRDLSIAGFGDLAKVEPQLASMTIAEVGGVNYGPGQYEPGEILEITVPSKNTGSIPVSNIAHALSANPAYFTIVPKNPGDYVSLAVGATTTSVYTVTISAGAPNGSYPLYATNSASGSAWVASTNLPITKVSAPTSYSVTSAASDGHVKSNGEISTDFMYVGDVSGIMYSSVVMFQLPTLPAGHKVVSADLRMNAAQNTYTGGVDLYALRKASDPSIIPSDFYSGAYGPSTGHTPIMDNFMGSSAPPGRYNVINATSQSALGTWLQAQYESGGVGNFAFLGLSPDTASTGSQRVRFSLSNDVDPLNRPTLTLTTQDARSSDLVYTNTTPAQFIQKPGVTTNLSLAVRNDGFAASGVTVGLSVNPVYSSWLTVNTGTISIPTVGAGETVNNLFNVSIAANAPVGTYANAFTLNMSGIGLNGTTNNASAPVGLEIINTAFASMNRTSFVAPVGASDVGTLTISNTASWALSYTLSSGQAWLQHPTGTLSLPAGAVTTITVTANASALGQGQYKDTLTVAYLNNTSQPNPATFAIVFDVGPKIEPLLASAVITEAGGVNNLPGQYEPGEILEITVTSTNNGSVTVNNIAHTLSVNGYFAITAISNAANYAVMPVGSSASTIYRISISANTPEGIYGLKASNSASGGGPWENTRNLAVVSHADPSVSPNTLTIAAVTGQAATNTVTVTNDGNAPVNFSVGLSGTWAATFDVESVTPSRWETGGTILPLNDPNTNNPYIGPGDSGESDTIPIGFGFSFYGTTYGNLYVDSNGAIILSPTALTNNTKLAESGTGALPQGTRPLIAPFRSSQLSVNTKPIRYVRKSDRLIIIHDLVDLSAYPTSGTGLQFQTELLKNGQIQFNYKTINGSIGLVASGIQGATAGQVLNTGIVPASGTAVRITPSSDVWVSANPAVGSVPAFGSKEVSFISNAAGQAPTTNHVTATFNWSGGETDGTSEDVAITATIANAAPVYSAPVTFAFSGPSGAVATAPFTIGNPGTAPLDFVINNSASASAGYANTNPAISWIDISSTGTGIVLNDPDVNPYITAEDEGYSSMIPIGFAFPLYGGNYTEVSVSANGALRFDKSDRILAERDLASANSTMPEKLIAPFWADLILDGNATLKYRSTAEQMVITWDKVQQRGLNGGADQTFQAILRPDGAILFQYKQLEGARWQEAVIGLRDTTNRTIQASIVTDGDWSLATNAVSGWVSTQYVGSVSSRATEFKSVQTQTIRYEPGSGTIPPGGTAVITMIGDASNLSAGASASANLSVVHNAAGSPGSINVTFTATGVQAAALAIAGDSDGDGLTDDAERIAGTDPQDSGSVFSPVLNHVSGGMELSWPYADGRSYTVLYTTNLADPFVVLVSGLQAGGFVHVTDEPTTYYKIMVE